MRRRRRQDVLIGHQYLLASALAVVVVVADLLTKSFAAANFTDHDVVVIPGFFGFTFTENPGAAFSLFENAGPFLGVAAIVVTGILLWALRTQRPTFEIVAFGLVMGGAVGNLIDRITRGEGLLDGKVIDWIILWWIPTFNIADAAVSTAVALLLIYTWRSRDRSQFPRG